MESTILILVPKSRKADSSAFLEELGVQNKNFSCSVGLHKYNVLAKLELQRSLESANTQIHILAPGTETPYRNLRGEHPDYSKLKSNLLKYLGEKGMPSDDVLQNKKRSMDDLTKTTSKKGQEGSEEN